MAISARSISAVISATWSTLRCVGKRSSFVARGPTGAGIDTRPAPPNGEGASRDGAGAPGGGAVPRLDGWPLGGRYPLWGPVFFGGCPLARAFR